MPVSRYASFFASETAKISIGRIGETKNVVEAANFPSIFRIQQYDRCDSIHRRWNAPRVDQLRQCVQEEICERYRRLYAGVIYDVLEHLGYPNQVLTREFAPLLPQMKLAGPAFTVKGTTSSERDETLRYRRLQMIKQMRRPCIEVRDR